MAQKEDEMQNHNNLGKNTFIICNCKYTTVRYIANSILLFHVG